jgi:hypothetical protein
MAGLATIPVHKIRMVFILATVPAWSSTPGPINPADSGKNLTADLNTTADTIFKTAIILARGGNGGGGSDGDCDGTGDGPGPAAGPIPGPDANGYSGAAAGPGRGAGSSENR